MPVLYRRGLLESTRVTMIAPEYISPNPDQPRRYFDPDGLSELADSIRAHGILQPLSVRRKGGGRYELIAGERRLRAAMICGLEQVPCLVLEVSRESSCLLSLIENLQREDLNPMEEAAGYRSLIEDYGLTQEEAAQRVSRSRPAVANAMRLLALPQEVQWLIEQGNLSAGHGRALLSLPTPEEQIAFAEEIMAHHWSVRETEERIRRILHQMNQPDEPKEDAPLKIYFQEAERKLTADLGRKVTISQGKKKGKIALEYYDQEDLELLMQALATLEARKEGRAEP